jgi:hypothetical protein
LRTLIWVEGRRLRRGAPRLRQRPERRRLRLERAHQASHEAPTGSSSACRAGNRGPGAAGSRSAAPTWARNSATPGTCPTATDATTPTRGGHQAHKTRPELAVEQQRTVHQRIDADIADHLFVDLGRAAGDLLLVPGASSCKQALQ